MPGRALASGACAACQHREQHTVERVAGAGRVDLVDLVGRRGRDEAVDDSTAPPPIQLHRGEAVSLAERAGRRRRPVRPVSASASRSFANTAVADAVSSKNRSAPNDSTQRPGCGLDADADPRWTARQRRERRFVATVPAATGSPETSTAPASISAGRSPATRRAFAPRSATIERSPGSCTTSIVPVGASGSTVTAASTPRAARPLRTVRPCRSSPTRPSTRVDAPAQAPQTAAFARGAARLQQHPSVHVASALEGVGVDADVEHDVAHAHQVHGGHPSHRGRSRTQRRPAQLGRRSPARTGSTGSATNADGSVRGI